MATLDELAAEHPVTGGFGGWLLRALASVKRWHDRRHTLARLSRLSERQLSDLGFEPDDTCGSLDGQRASMWVEPHMRPDIR